MLKRSVRIGPGQLVLLLTVFRVFDLLTYSPGIGGAENGATVLAAFVPALLLLALVMLPAGLLISRFHGRDVVTCALSLSKPVGKVLAAVLCLFLLLLAGDTISSFEFLLTTAVYPQTPPMFFIVTMALACTYAAYLGLEPIARVNTLVFFALVGMVVFLAVAILPEANAVYLRSPFSGGTKPFWRCVLQLCFANVDVIAWLLITPHLNGVPAKSFGGWLLATAVLSEALLLLLLLSLGDYAGAQAFPFLTLASVAEISIFQRLDSLHITLWTFLAFCKISALLFLARQALGQLLTQKDKKAPLFFCGALAAVCAAVLSSDARLLIAARGILKSGVPVAVLAVLVPFVLLIWAVAAKKKGVRA